MLRLEPEEWQAMYYRHIGGRNRFDQRSFYGQRISDDDLNYERPRICPRCLKERPIWWAVWDLGPFIDKNRECALGASYGGYMANWVLGHTDRFKCIVSHDGMFNAESAFGTTEEDWFNKWEFKGNPWDYYGKPDAENPFRKWSPSLYAKNFKTPTLVVHGQLDYRLDVSEGYQLFDTLQRSRSQQRCSTSPTKATGC